MSFPTLEEMAIVFGVRPTQTTAGQRKLRKLLAELRKHLSVVEDLGIDSRGLRNAIRDSEYHLDEEA